MRHRGSVDLKFILVKTMILELQILYTNVYESMMKLETYFNEKVAQKNTYRAKRKGGHT